MTDNQLIAQPITGTRVAVIGSGYVGTVVAACLAHVGHQVIGVEADRDKLASLDAGRAPFFEPYLDELIAAGAAAGRLRFGDDIAAAMSESEIVFICVGTPPGPTGEPDMSAMAAVATAVAPHVHGHILVNKSTVPLGSGRWLTSMIEEAAPDPAIARGQFQVVSNPEFLREGNAIDDYLFPERIVLGSDDPRALDELASLYRPILERRIPGAPLEPVPLIRTDLATAEMLKYASNAFLAVKISFANELARLCEFVGAEITEVAHGMGLDSRIGAGFLNAGLGWGGSCFGKDTAALIATARDYGYSARILESAVEVNEDQRRLAVELLLRHLRTLRGARVALLGLAFKGGTDDIRDSPAVDLGRRLQARGCFVTAFDPMVHAVAGLRVAADAYEAARGADAVIIATDWTEFRSLDLARLHDAAPGSLLLDGRNLLDPAAVNAAGFRYQGIGRQAGPGHGDRRRAALPTATPA